MGISKSLLEEVWEPSERPDFTASALSVCAGVDEAVAVAPSDVVPRTEASECLVGVVWIVRRIDGEAENGVKFDLEVLDAFFVKIEAVRYWNCRDACRSERVIFSIFALLLSFFLLISYQFTIDQWRYISCPATPPVYSVLVEDVYKGLLIFKKEV